MLLHAQLFFKFFVTFAAMFHLTIVTLVKEDIAAFSRTAASIRIQKFDGTITWLVIDGSAEQVGRRVSLMSYELVDTSLASCLNVNYLNSREMGVSGVYPSMNLAADHFAGDAVIYLNAGDELHNECSLALLAKYFYSSPYLDKMAVFGQALVVPPAGRSWFFPGKLMMNLKGWLRAFEPNHQSMLVSTALARQTVYDESLPSSADKLWKRDVISRCAEIFYIRSPVVNFYLGGLSSSRFNFALARVELMHASLPIHSKTAMIAKMLIPPPFFRFYYICMKCKSLLFDFLFAVPPLLGGAKSMFSRRPCAGSAPLAISLRMPASAEKLS